MSNTPSDDVLFELIKEHFGLDKRPFDTVIDRKTGRFHDAARYRDFAAAVLAKWGTPQPAPAPLSEMPYEKRKAIQEGEQIGASDAWFHARHNMLDTLDRRNVFRAGFDRGWNAAIAAQERQP